MEVYWTYDRCFQEALKYKKRNEFRKSCQGAYDASRRNNWYNDYTWFEPSASAKKWTYETCFNEAKKYTTKKDFRTKSESAYIIALNNKWVGDYTWLKNSSGIKGNIDNVYIYFWKELNTVYVGRTVHPKQRDNQHLYSNETVAKFSKEHNLPVPEMKILYSNITIDEGLFYEDLLVQQFKANGFNVLNKGKTGINSGSIGGLITKWTYDACYNEALKYKTKGTFAKEKPCAYARALANKWLDDYTWFIPHHHHKWTYEECIEEAKKYETVTEFRKNASGAATAAYDNGWLKDFTWFKNGKKLMGIKKTKWTYENTYQEALKYKTVKNFQKGSGGAFHAAYRHHWMKDYDWLYL